MFLFLLTSFTQEKKTTIFIIGDSTAAKKDLSTGSPERGWGMALQDYFTSPVVVDNHAVNGRSSLSFYNEGRWAKVLEKMQPGDYVIIQFGHNDEKPAVDRHTEAHSTFQWMLERYVRETREKGGIPILMNCVVRRNYTLKVDGKAEDEALRNTFLEEVNLLILSIPTRSDKEIIISLQKIAALLHDAHTVVDTSTDSFLGIFAGPLHTQTGMVYGILMARKEYESLLMSRLDGINGVPIEEIMERLRPLVSYDCEIHYQDRACSYSYLSDPDVLRYIGVMGPEDMAVLSLTGLDGKAYEYTVRASSTKTWDWNDYVEYVSGTGNDSSDMGIYTCGASNFIIYGTEKYWYETLADGKAVYIRLNSCPSDENTISFFEEAFSSVDLAELEKVIIDFRFNSGGDASLGGGFGKLLTLIKATDADVYVLINGTSMSAGTAIPALLKRYAPKVTLVGAPSGQGVRCFSYMSLNNSDALPNSGLLIYCSQMYSDSWPGYDEPTLMPDVEIEQTFEDYQNGIDSVLKYVLGQTEP